MQQSEPLAVMKTSAMQWARMQLHTKSCLNDSILGQLNHFFRPEPILHSPIFKVLSSNMDGDFCLGGDLTLLAELVERRDKRGLYSYATNYLTLVNQLLCGSRENFTSVAVVQGRAFGAGMLVALAADIVVVESQAEFMNSSMLFEEYPCAVLAKKLRNSASRDVIMEVLCSGKRYSAQALFELGMIDVVCEKGDAERQVYEIIARAKQSHYGRIALQNYRKNSVGLTHRTRKLLVDKWVSNISDCDARFVQYLRRLGRLQSE
ncbi:enoyl-CoA hydratase-related protein [Pseudoalteromonas luteoviolacea]|uniref:Enoyl-CoA hydratase n=1 Tax=Pseudoalteromonas luteoviolacea NCIMB 1942 TaxID=1365253 RepID=A0A167H8A1_9GAMM|nr:enoyl-CoA hydratase-related protein [Pseudoalteromonas luteoviolacea]KZN57746.1 hypothetical protein N482_04405 [Pseudoalteromonas luteoviolacea NCIMB 1942]KZW99883.1 hypothetical protein JL49_14745 [Pseudoalteromonas luteoviolacea]